VASASNQRPRRARPKAVREASPLRETQATFQPDFVDMDTLAEPLMVLPYGNPGTGKTRFALTWPKPIVFDFDRGASVMRQLPAEQRADIRVVRLSDKWVRDPDTRRLYLPDGHSAVQQLWAYYKWLKAGDHDRETAVIDTVTDLQRLVMDDVMRQNPTRERETATTPCTENYQECGQRMDTFFRYFRELPMHVVWTAHAKDKKDKSGAVTQTTPELSPKTALSLAGKCHVVLYTACIVDDQDHPSPYAAQGTDGQWVRFVGQTRTSSLRDAKDRSGEMQTPYDDLHFEAVARAWKLPPFDGGDDDAPDVEPEPPASDDDGTRAEPGELPCGCPDDGGGHYDDCPVADQDSSDDTEAGDGSDGDAMDGDPAPATESAPANVQDGGGDDEPPVDPPPPAEPAPKPRARRAPSSDPAEAVARAQAATQRAKSKQRGDRACSVCGEMPPDCVCVAASEAQDAPD